METGTKGFREITVTEDMAASKSGMGPALIGFMETTCYESIMSELEEGQATVGAKVDVTHMAATPIGMKVRIETELLEVKGSKLVFKVEAFDEVEKAGQGTHVRFIIDKQGFNDNLEKKKK